MVQKFAVTLILKIQDILVLITSMVILFTLYKCMLNEVLMIIAYFVICCRESLFDYIDFFPSLDSSQLKNEDDGCYIC